MIWINKKMEFSFSFTLLAYYTWWILLLMALIIIIYKLMMQQNFQVSLRVSINSTGQGTELDQFTFQPVFVCHKNKKSLNKKEDSDSESNKDDKVQA